MATDLLDWGNFGTGTAARGRRGRIIAPKYYTPRRGYSRRGKLHFYSHWEDNLAGHWPLDEASGTRYDVLGVSPLAQTGGVGYTIGVVGNAAVFTPVRYLSCPSNSNLRLGGTSFTWAFWAKINSTLANHPFIWKFQESLGQREYTLGYEVGPGLVFRVYPDGTLLGVQTLTVGALSASQWYWICAGYNAATGSLYCRVYQPSSSTPVLSASMAVTGGPISGSADLWLGQRDDAYWLNGLMDSVWLWKRSLSIDEETTLFNQGSGYEPSLVLPQRHAGRMASGWRDVGRLLTGHNHHAPVPNQNIPTLPLVLPARRAAGWRESWRAYRGWTRRGAVPNPGLAAGSIVADHTFEPAGQPYVDPRQKSKGRVTRGQVPCAEFQIARGRMVQGWRKSLPPFAGLATRHRLPMLRGLERFPHRTAKGWTHGAAPIPFVGHTRRHRVPHNYPVDDVLLVDDSGNFIVDESGNQISVQPSDTGETAAQVVRRHPFHRPWRPTPQRGRVTRGAVMGLGDKSLGLVERHKQATPKRQPPQPGRCQRRTLPPTGLADAPVATPHTVKHGATPQPWPGRTRRGTIPGSGLVARAIVPARVGRAPRAPVQLLGGRCKRSQSRRGISALSNVGHVISGRYYVAAADLYVAGAVAGQAIVE